MKRNPQYEAGFIRQVADDDLTPQEQAIALAAAGRRRKWLLAGGGLLIAAIAAAGVVQARRDTPAKQVARAKIQASNGQHYAAVIEFKRSLQESPDQPEARFLLGNELSSLGDYKSAEIEYRKAIASGLPSEKALVPLTTALAAQGKFAEVVSQVNDASVESPEVNAELQTMLGTAYIGLGKTEAGLSAFKAAKEMVPNFSGASIAEARFMAAEGRYESADAMLASVPVDDKRQSETQALRGDVAKALNKTQDAFAAYQAALKLDPTNQNVRMQLVQIHVDLGQYDLAQTQIAMVTKANPTNARAQYLTGMLAYLRHDLVAARAAVDQSLQLAPKNAKAHMLAGVISTQLGDPVAAELHLRESILQLPPPALEARKALAELYLQRRELQQADEVLQPAMAVQSSDPQVAALAVKIALLQADPVKASNLFERFAGRPATDVDASLVGASLLFTAGKPDAALARLNAASKANPDNAEIDAALVTGLLQLRRIDAARAAWQVLDRKTPDSARAYALRSRIDVARGDDAAARQALERAVAIEPLYFPAIAGLVDLDIKTQQPDQARARLKRVIAADPGSVDAPLLLARVEEASGQPAAAAELLATALTRKPQSIQAIAAAIDFHRRHDDRAAELAAVERGLTVDPNNQDWLLRVGDLSLGAGKKERALVAFTKLTALNHENADYGVRLGAVQLASGQTEAALASYRSAFKSAPQRIDLQASAVEAFVGAGRTEEATRLLFDMSKTSPNAPMLGELAADIKLAAKQYPEALAAYRQALAATPSTRVAIKTYQTMVLAKQRGQANTLLADWQRSHPADTAMWLFDAQVALDAKDFDRAANAYRSALDTKPNDPVILNNLAWTLDRTKDPRALAYAEKAHALAPDNADLADTLGWILVNQGQTQRGVEVISRAATLAPSKMDIRLRLAKAQIKDGHKDAARATLKGVIDQAPESAEGSESKSLLSTL